VRLRATNATGLELNTELVEWLKLDYLRRATGMDLGEFDRFAIDGRSYWVALADAIHVGERPEKLDEVNAVRWARFSRKARRGLNRRFPDLDPFGLPTADTAELRAWVLHGTLPSWAEDSDGEPDPDTDEYPVAADELEDAPGEDQRDSRSGLQCPECGRAFPDLTGFTEHLASHQGR